MRAPCSSRTRPYRMARTATPRADSTERVILGEQELAALPASERIRYRVISA